ncbi:MAG: phage terminase large subunit family protein, partial [Bacteroidaceae bacterium]|nr:phage terminase large subunit family protein [Bacteroidaceae bacterium]
LRKNVTAPLWEVPSNAPTEYLDMLDSESRTYDKGRWIWKQIGERPNHYLDCEAMQVCAAIMLKLVGSESVSSSE